MATRKRKVNMQPLWRFLFVLYAGLMLWLLFARSPGWDSDYEYRELLRMKTNLTPFFTINNYLNVLQNYPDSPEYGKCLIELFGNVLMFVPAGWLLPKLFAPMRKFFYFLLTCLLAITFVEALQLLTLLGRFDVDDIILNIAGMLIGYIIYAITQKK